MKPLTLEMSDPLTLGMGHPVTERIRRLSMRKTNLLTKSGTCALIIAALGLTAPVFTATATSPVTEIVDSLAKRAEDTLGGITPSSTELPSTEQPQKQVQLMASSTPSTSANAPEYNGLKPMRLRMSPRFTPDQISKIEVYRQTISGGDKTAKKALRGYTRNLNKNNRMQMFVKDDGQTVLYISNGTGGWDKRPLSAEMKSATREITQRCAKAKAPVYFQMDISGGDADLGSGTYEIECLPGAEAVQKNTKEIDLAKAYLASNGLPLSRRQDGFQWRMRFAMMNEYVRTTPNATIASDRNECVRVHSLMKEEYGFTERNRNSADYHLQKCPTTDYNWIRKRMGISEVK